MNTHTHTHGTGTQKDVEQCNLPLKPTIWSTPSQKSPYKTPTHEHAHTRAHTPQAILFLSSSLSCTPLFKVFSSGFVALPWKSDMVRWPPHALYSLYAPSKGRMLRGKEGKEWLAERVIRWCFWDCKTWFFPAFIVLEMVKPLSHFTFLDTVETVLGIHSYLCMYLKKFYWISKTEGHACLSWKVVKLVECFGFQTWMKIYLKISIKILNWFVFEVLNNFSSSFSYSWNLHHHMIITLVRLQLNFNQG